MSDTEDEGEILHSVKVFDRFEWTIHDFACQSICSCTRSPVLRFAEINWHLAIWKRGSEANGHISLTLSATQNSVSRHKVRIGMKKKDGKDGMLVNGETDCDGFFEIRKLATWSELSKMKAKFFPNGILTIFCEMCIEATEEGTSKLMNMSTSVLLKDLKDLLLGGQNSDVVIKVENKEFKAHRAIIGCRCPVFASMFQHDMAENKTGIVDIPDCTAEAFEILLLYLYTGEIDGCTSDTVSNLYYAADKYDIQEVKKHCVKFMKSNLSIDNFIDILSMSLCHKELDLLETATHFFTENVKTLIKRPPWQTFMKENPVYANELYIKAIEA